MFDSVSQSGQLVVARAGLQVVGFVWFEPRGAFAQSPYLKLIAVDEGQRNAGIGAALLQAFEERTAMLGRAWLLLVSDFNEKAISFYERHGYEKAGRLHSFARDGIDEIIMYKLHA